MASVAVVQRVLFHYRVPFFERLRARLDAAGVELTLVVGQTSPAEEHTGESATVPWAAVVRNRYLPGPGRLVWQPAWRHLHRADLVVVEQANRLLLNHVLQLRRSLRRGPRLAFWGHGANLDQRTASPLGEWWKQRALRRCDWWFAYTSLTVELVAAAGYPRERITDVQNAVDTTELRRAIDPAARAARRAQLGSEHVGVFLASLHERKRVPFLLEAADAARARVDDFVLLVIGDGPDRPLVEAAAAERAWLHVLGPRHGAAMVAEAGAGDVLLNPGLVGLGIVDSFALELPLVTCELDYHSPEIAYLAPGHNGVLLPGATTAAEYGRVVAELLTDPDRLAELRAGCRHAAATYTIEAMADRFAAGVLQALGRGG
jgi:glycosyltransferase involved in cell wall biosynthesis